MEISPPELIDDEATGIDIVADKPIVPEGIYPILTRAAFMAVLDRPPIESIIWVAELERKIETNSVCFSPWGSMDNFLPLGAILEPFRVVRAWAENNSIEPVDRWLLRDASSDVSGGILATWRERAVRVLSSALSQEIERDGRLLFRGPPATRFRFEGARNTTLPAFASLQRAVAWVYENPRELENRHGILAAEVARTALRDGDLSDMAATLSGALEGAKIAYSFGISQQSRDVLKALSDLRKAISDETTKLAESTRSLAAAVTTSAVGNIGLIIARITLAKDSHFVDSAAIAIAVALTLYVLVIMVSGFHYLSIQRDLRVNWRERLYRFLGNEEYKRMVTDPVTRAERGFRNTAIGSGLIILLMLSAVWFVVSEMPASDNEH